MTCGIEPAIGARRHQAVVEERVDAARDADERLVLEPSKTEALYRSQRMRSGSARTTSTTSTSRAASLRHRSRTRAVDESRIDAVGVERRQLLRRDHVREVELDLGFRRAEGADCLGHDGMRRGRLAAGEPEGADLAERDAPCAVGLCSMSSMIREASCRNARPALDRRTPRGNRSKRSTLSSGSSARIAATARVARY